MPTHHLKNSVHPSWPVGAWLAGLAGLMLLVGWRRWTHAFIDFGREIYVPWQLSQGEVLYHDIAYFNGPLSPHLNALAFWLFGASLTTLVLFNLALLAVTTGLLYRLLFEHADRLTAVVGSSLFLTVFALADLVGFGNYNFITPYSHEMTHGMLLCLLLLSVLAAALRTPSRGRHLMVGLLLGLIFLTKAEFFVAALAAIATGLAIEYRHRREVGAAIRWILLGCGGAILTTLSLLLTQAPPATAVKGVLGPWAYLLVGELTDLVFYKKGMGTDTPSENLRRLVTWLGIYLLIFAPVWLIARRVRPDSPRRRVVAAGLVLWVGLILLVVAPRFELSDLPRPLPLILALIAAIAVWRQLRVPRPERTLDSRMTARLAGLVFALALLAKMALNTRFHNYGFSLALPAAMVLVALLLYGIPRQIDRQGGYGPGFRAAGLVFVVLVGIAFTWPSILVYRQKTTVVGEEADRFRVQPRYALAQRLLERLPEHLGPGETLLVLPEGIMLNYQLRVENPTSHINFMPPEMIMFGEDEIIAALDQNPPDVIVLLKRRTLEYGFETIGDGYGEDLMRWVGARYPIVETIEEPGLYGKNFGKAFVLRYRPDRPVATPDIPEPRAAS